jgi:hypothetical protein
MYQIFKAPTIDFELQIMAYDEPNNGRELWVADIVINGNNYNHLFKNNWNRLNFYLNHYQMCPENAQFVFIPAEGNSFLINMRQINAPIFLPYKPLSTLEFSGNFFQSDYLILIYTDEITLFHLYKQTYITFTLA